MEKKRVIILLVLILLVAIAGYFIYSEKSGFNNITVKNSDVSEDNLSIKKINKINKSFEALLLKGMENESETIADSNKENLSIFPTSLEKDVIAIYEYGEDEYYILRIRAVDKENSNVEDNILYAARIVNSEFERTTRFYHLLEGDYFITESSGKTYIFGWIPERGYHFELAGKIVPVNKSGLLGLILDEQEPDLEIKKDADR